MNEHNGTFHNAVFQHKKNSQHFSHGDLKQTAMIIQTDNQPHKDDSSNKRDDTNTKNMNPLHMAMW